MELDLAWNPAWWQPGVSFWAVAVKVAIAADLPLRRVLQDVYGWDERAPSGSDFSHIWAPTEEQAERLTGRFSLTSAVDSMFFGSAQLGFERRLELSLGLRWCPECAKAWYHAPCFQEASRATCPWHGTPLLDSCPRCCRSIDPFAAAWACGYCKTSLAETGQHWLDRLRASPGHSGVVPAVPGERLWTTVEVDGSQAFVRAAEEQGDWLGAPIFPAMYAETECLHALWDSFGHTHARCIAGEPHIYPTHRFCCPVVASFIRVCNAAGRTGFPWSRAWDIHTLRLAPWRHMAVRGAVSMKLSGRAFVCSTLHDYLLAFSAAKAAGRDELLSEPQGVIPYDLISNGVNQTLRLRVSDAQLVSAMRAADAACNSESKA